MAETGEVNEVLRQWAIGKMAAEYLKAVRKAAPAGSGRRPMQAEALLRAATELWLEERSREDLVVILRTLADELGRQR